MKKKDKLSTYTFDDIISFYKNKKNKQILNNKKIEINTKLKVNSYKKL